MREPFLLMAGYGRAGELLAKDFDTLGQQLVVIDESSDRIDALELGSFHADIPGLALEAMFCAAAIQSTERSMPVPIRR